MASDATSVTSVSSLLDSPARPRQSERPSVDVAKWAQDSLAALERGPSKARSGDPAAPAAATSVQDDEELGSPGVLQLQLQVANTALADCKGRTRQLEAQLRDLRAELEEARSGREAAKASQALLLQRISELEAQLKRTAEAEQAKAGQLARLEGRAAVAEGSLKAAEQQVSQALAELQEQRAKEMQDLAAKHARELQQLQEQHSTVVAQLKAGYESKVADLAKAARCAEHAAAKEQHSAQEMAVQLEKAQSKSVAVKELMRHSEELQAQVERLQQSVQEERRRATRSAQSSEAALAAERQMADAAAQEMQVKMQEASREQEKALRQAKAKLQRAEMDLRGAKLHSGQLAERVSELESLNAKKDLQLDTAAQEVDAMQQELQALRQGLSSRDLAAMEAARAQYAAALEASRADLRTARQQLSEQTLLLQRQSSALCSVADILAAHAGTSQDPQPLGHSGSHHGPVDPEKVVAFVEAVTGTLGDVQQQWELEKQELEAALGAAEAVKEQLEVLLQQEREQGQQTSEQQRNEVDAVRKGQEALQRDLSACRAELTRAVAKAAAATEDCAKWRSTAEALEGQLQQAQLVAEASRQEAVELKGLAAAKDERIKEMRNAMASALDDKSSTATDLQRQLATRQQTEQALQECQAEIAQLTAGVDVIRQAAAEAVPKLGSILQAFAGLEGGRHADSLSTVLSNATSSALAAFQPLLESSSTSPCSSRLAGVGRAVLQLSEALSQALQMVDERAKIHYILTAVNAKLGAATAQHNNLLTGSHGLASAAQGTASLVTLLQQLTESVVGLIESLAAEKECLASEMLHVGDENRLLQSQIQSMQSVLASLQSDANLEQQLADTLVSWNQAQARISTLEADNAQLQQRLQQAQEALDGVRAASSREWAGMRDDIAHLVQHAEQAQVDAEAAVARLRAECDEKVQQLQQEVAQAASGRDAAEASVVELRGQLQTVQTQLVHQSNIEAEGQDITHAALQAAQLGIQQLEAQVAQLQRKLVARVKARVGFSAPMHKKAAAASTKAALLKRENGRLTQQQAELRQQIATLEATIRQGSHQLKQGKEQAAAAQTAVSEAQAKVARLEALLRKVDERKASIDIERRRAQEAAARLEQQVLELQCKLEASQHRERVAQADAEQLRSVLAKREQESKQLSGAVQQVEVAEEALRDSHATASRLLQECTEGRRAKQELQGQVNLLTRQLQDAQQAHAGALQQVQDLQEAFDTALTELDIARSLLASQRQQDARPDSHQAAGGPDFYQDVDAYPVVLGSGPGSLQASQQAAMDNLMRQILGASNGKLGSQGGKPGPAGCTLPNQPGCQPAEQVHDSRPPTQQRIRTPCTSLTAQKGNCAVAPHMADDASSHRPTPDPGGAACSDENCPQAGAEQPQQLQKPFGQQACCDLRPESAASTASQAQQCQPVDVDDLRSLVLAVESLQRQLAVKNDRIKELRAALQRQQANGADARPGSSGGQHKGSAESFVLQQKLDAAMQQLESTQALVVILEAQLADAQKVKQELQQQLSNAAAKLAAVAMGGPSLALTASSRQQHPLVLGGEAGLHQQLAQFEQQLLALEEQLGAGQAELDAARARGDNLTIELAERDALMEALQTQLASMAHARSCAGTQTEDGEAVAVAVAAVKAASRPPSRAAEEVPPGASVQASGALGSLDRIVGLWKQACKVKDKQIRELQGKLEEAQDALASVEAGHDALLQQVQDSAAAVHSLQQLVHAAEAQLSAAHHREEHLGSRVTEMEEGLQATEERLQACNQELAEARRQQMAAERRCSSLQQQLAIAVAQVREVQHAAQLERASQGDAAALRQQLAAAKVELAGARDAANDSQQRAKALEQQLHEQRQATASAAASNASATDLSHELEIVRAAERKLLKEAQDAQAQLATAQQQNAELQQSVAMREAQLRQACQRLESTEGQLQEALGALQEQHVALEEMHAALEQARQEHQEAATVASDNQQAAAALASSRQELSIVQQRLEVAEKQMEVLRAQLSNAESDKAQVAAGKRRLQAYEGRLNDAMLRYQTGLATLSSALRQLQSADMEGGLDVLAVLGHYQGAGAQQSAAGSQQLPVEELVDEILFHVHRRDCDISALVAQVSQLEAALASKTSEVSEQQARLQGHLGSISRVKEQLQWCMRECEALKRQLSDKDEQIARLRAAAASTGAADSASGQGLGRAGSGQPGASFTGGWAGRQRLP